MRDDITEPGAEPVRNSSELSARFGTVKEASSELGISERAVIKRITTGALTAIREGKQWRVRLPDLPGEQDANTGGSEPVPNFAEPTELDSELAEPGAESVPNDKDALIEELKADVEFLRSQLQQRDVAESEFRRLLLSRDMEIGRLQQENRLLLAAPIPYEVSVQEPVQDVPEETSPVPPGSPETRSETGIGYQDGVKVQEAQETGKPRKAWWQRFWQR